MGLRGRGQPGVPENISFLGCDSTATGSGRGLLDTSSRDSEDAGDNGRVGGAKRLSSPQHHSPLCRCNIIRKLSPSSEFRTFILWKFFCTPTGKICTTGKPKKRVRFCDFENSVGQASGKWQKEKVNRLNINQLASQKVRVKGLEPIRAGH